MLFSHLGFATKCKKILHCNYCISNFVRTLSFRDMMRLCNLCGILLAKRIRIDTAQNIQFYMLDGIHALNMPKRKVDTVQRPVIMRQVRKHNVDEWKHSAVTWRRMDSTNENFVNHFIYMKIKQFHKRHANCYHSFAFGDVETELGYNFCLCGLVGHIAAPELTRAPVQNH